MSGANPTKGTTWAVVVAVALLTGSGSGYWLLAEHLARAPGSAPLPPGALETLPLRIGEWIGRDAPLDEAIVREADTDLYLSRIYARHGGTQAVALYIAYGVRARDLMPHRPEVCYPGAGWTQQDRQRVRVTLADSQPLECTLYAFTRGGFTAATQMVLNYYLIDGESSADVEALRSRAWRGSGAVRYVAQVQIAATADDAAVTKEVAIETLRAFAAEVGPAIRVLMPEPQAAASAAQAQPDQGDLP